MSIQFACDTAKAATPDLRRPKCPRCGSMLLIAEESVFNLNGRIHNVWSCDECAHEFATSIALWSH